MLRFYGPVNPLGSCQAWSGTCYTSIYSTPSNDSVSRLICILAVCISPEGIFSFGMAPIFSTDHSAYLELVRRHLQLTIFESRFNDLVNNISVMSVCLFVLRFYGPVNPMGSCRARSVYLTTCLLGRLSPLSG